MTRLFLSTAVLLLAACEPPTDPTLDTPETAGLAADPSPTTGETADKTAAGVLAFVNAADTSFDVLDLDVGLDRRAAERIIRHRDGADRTWGTDDDDHFDTIAELLSVDWVGPTSLTLIEGWLAEAAADGTVIEGVAFTDDEATLVVSMVNTVDADYLDDTLELDVRAVDGILDARPLPDLRALAAVPYVGPATLERLRAAVTP